VRLAETTEHPWPHAGAPAILGHEFHHSSLENVDPGVRWAYHVLRGQGVDGKRDGVCVHNVLASYAHLRHTGGNDWPKRFVGFVRSCRAHAAAAPPPRAMTKRTSTRRIAR
jgi:cobyrinic acid a,c-diamide synthase